MNRRHFIRARDNLTEAGANELAADLKVFWGERGYRPEIWIERASADERSLSWAVRSDMVNGLPRGADGVRI